MYAFSIMHWLVLLIILALMLYPVGRILSRVGLSPIWAIVSIIPLLNFVALWVFAFMTWPKIDRQAKAFE